MCPRPYRMKQRSESAELTRDRIVRATYELHAEKGIAATTVRDIATRADVSVGAIYSHFPSYEDVVAACGAYTSTLAPLPDAGLFDGVAAPAARLHALVAALFGVYQRIAGFERARAERAQFAQLETFFRNEEDNRRALLAAAVRPRRLSRRGHAMAFALLDVCVYRALLTCGLDHATAVDETAALLQRLLLES